MDISKYEPAIQKAINNFEETVERIKLQQQTKKQHVATTLQNIQKDLTTLKSALNK
jgi:hypothetical protein